MVRRAVIGGGCEELAGDPGMSQQLLGSGALPRLPPQQRRDDRFDVLGQPHAPRPAIAADRQRVKNDSFQKDDLNFENQIDGFGTFRMYRVNDCSSRPDSECIRSRTQFK